MNELRFQRLTLISSDMMHLNYLRWSPKTDNVISPEYQDIGYPGIKFFNVKTSVT